MDTEGIKLKALKVHDALLVAACVAVLIGAIYQSSQPDLDPEDYMILNKVYIPDHLQREDPSMIYDREVRQDFDAGWRVVIESTSTGKVVCKGSGLGEYRVGERLPEITLSWYIGKFCNLPPDQYFATTNWRIPNGVLIDNTSNVFEVSANGRPDLMINDNR